MGKDKEVLLPCFFDSKDPFCREDGKFDEFIVNFTLIDSTPSEISLIYLTLFPNTRLNTPCSNGIFRSPEKGISPRRLSEQMMKFDAQLSKGSSASSLKGKIY